MQLCKKIMMVVLTIWIASILYALGDFTFWILSK